VRRELTVIGVATAIAASLVAGAIAARATVPPRTFYLDLKAGQCAKQATPKYLQVVPCSNGSHTYEVFAVLHGGWGHTNPPGHSAAFARAQQLCMSAFEKRYGGPIRQGYGWYGFWPDPGPEATKYGDRVVCSLVRWPGRPAMGSGTHLRQATA
jgi:hypothetical protein